MAETFTSTAKIGVGLKRRTNFSEHLTGDLVPVVGPAEFGNNRFAMYVYAPNSIKANSYVTIDMTTNPYTCSSVDGSTAGTAYYLNATAAFDAGEYGWVYGFEKILDVPVVAQLGGKPAPVPFSTTGITFPATQVPSSDPNTLDDYEEGTWTPVLTFGTPGDLNVSYSVRTGVYTKNGNVVSISCRIVTSAFTWTTASGALTIDGVPFGAKAQTGHLWVASLIFSGITKAGFTQFVPFISQTGGAFGMQACGTGVGNSNVNAADAPSGGSVVLSINFSYQAS